MKAKIKALDLVEQKLLDFLKSKGYDEEKVLKYIKEYSIFSNPEGLLYIDKIGELFTWKNTAEGHDFWSALDDEYRHLNQ